MVIIPMRPRSTFIPGLDGDLSDDGNAALRHLYTEMAKQRFPLVLAAYLRYLATELTKTNAQTPVGTEQGSGTAEEAKMTAFRRQCNEQREAWAEYIREHDGKNLDDAHVSDRARRAVAGLLTGYESFLAFAKDMHLTNELPEGFLIELHDALIRQIIMNTTTYMGGNRTPGELMMEEITSLLASGRAYLVDENGDEPASVTPATRCIGAFQAYKGDNAVFINPKAIEELIRVPARRVTTDLLAVSADTDFGHRTINRRINGQPNVRCVGIPLAIWNGDEDDLEDQRRDSSTILDSVDAGF
jgi:hypothetical protein